MEEKEEEEEEGRREMMKYDALVIFSFFTCFLSYFLLSNCISYLFSHDIIDLFIVIFW